MIITAHGHHGGDPGQYCERLVIESSDWHEATAIAELFRGLQDRERREKILRLAKELNEEHDARLVAC